MWVHAKSMADVDGHISRLVCAVELNLGTNVAVNRLYKATKFRDNGCRDYGVVDRQTFGLSRF